VGFITGGNGIGKTTLVDAFVAQAAAPGAVAGPRGNASSTTGRGSLPAGARGAGAACRGPEAAQVLALLEQHAPLWLLQLRRPAPPAREALQRQGRRHIGAHAAGCAGRSRR
jgi:hypothetical protein